MTRQKHTHTYTQKDLSIYTVTPDMGISAIGDAKNPGWVFPLTRRPVSLVALLMELTGPSSTFEGGGGARPVGALHLSLCRVILAAAGESCEFFLIPGFIQRVDQAAVVRPGPD